MRNLEPVPSPRGTNYERIFIVRRPGPVMAMDQEMVDPQDDGGDPGTDLADKIRELLVGKLEDSDIEALISLIMGGGEEQDAPTKQPPGIATDAKMRRRLADGAKARAKLGMDQRSDLMKRFPALATARVV
jgi:hypothetical protein